MKNIKHFFLLTLTGLLGVSGLCSAADITVSKKASTGSVALVANEKAMKLVVDKSDMEVVTIAAEAFANDVELLTGTKPVLAHTINNEAAVVIGTIGQSAPIDQLVKDGKINKTQLEGKWETFSISIVDQKLIVIAGSDPRGTAFGVFELSRKMGVSPWVWWADVTPEKCDAIYLSGDQTFGPPSVKYRGMFINDEDWGMQPWAAKNMDPDIQGPYGAGDIGPRTHEQIFELMLRTKSNFFWPGMHPSTKAFWYHKTNPPVAEKYQIFLGSSHCEPMLRDNEDEWNRNFTSEYPNTTKGNWNWQNNSTVITKYWEDRVIESKNNPAIYTVGMRDVHDGPMQGYANNNERADALLHSVIPTQRALLKKHINADESKVPQLFCPYKEALTLYNIWKENAKTDKNNWTLPEDISLLWPDDNHGYIRQLSDPTEQARSGGSGVYYHFSYWGIPQDWLWLSSASPALTSYEMCKAYDMNAKEMWMFNVGDLKPAELEYQFAMDLAWDVEAWRPEKAMSYIKLWATETFGAEFANEVDQIKREYHRLAASGKPEHINFVNYSEAQMLQRLDGYANIVKKSKALEAKIPARLQDAYYQLIAYPVEAAAAMNEKILCGKLSYTYAARNKKTEALAMADRAKLGYLEIRTLTQKYNKGIANGKWDGMMDYAPRGHSFFYDPDVVTEDAFNENAIPPEEEAKVLSEGAYNFKTKGNEGQHTIKLIEGLGVTKTAIAVLPLNMTSYTEANISTAPYVEYELPVEKGENIIRVKCLPTFPLYEGVQLRFGLSIDGGAVQLHNIAEKAESGTWHTNVLAGFAAKQTTYTADANKNIKVRIYFADPGLVVSELEVERNFIDPLTAKLKNPNFELGENDQPMDGTIKRGDPYGWTRSGSLNGESFGVNNDAANKNGNYVCWYNSTPMPSSFELSQTVKDLPAGEYIVRCQLAVFSGKVTNQRLFANNYVQYFESESSYASNLTPNEINTFAGYSAAGDGSNATLRDMALRVILLEGEDLKIGIRSSNKKANGSAASDNSGWFKVDNFRLECVREYTGTAAKDQLGESITAAEELYNTTQAGSLGGQYPAAARTAFKNAIDAAKTVYNNTKTTLPQYIDAINVLQQAVQEYKKQVVSYTSFLINPSFEYYLENGDVKVNDGATARRGTPYGWLDTGGLLTPSSGNLSYGINNDATNKDGNNACWVNSFPMPESFELYQELNGLPAGIYKVRCRLAVDKNKLTTQQLFANNSVQYFGYETDYDKNLNATTDNTFANWDATGFYLREMVVDVTLKKGEKLKLGIRTSNQQKDGTRITSNADGYNHGWFKTDHFRLELIEAHESVGLEKVEDASFLILTQEKGIQVNLLNDFKTAALQIFNLSGQSVCAQTITSAQTNVSLSQGLYVVNLLIDQTTKAIKVLIK